MCHVWSPLNTDLTFFKVISDIWYLIKQFVLIRWSVKNLKKWKSSLIVFKNGLGKKTFAILENILQIKENENKTLLPRSAWGWTTDAFIVAGRQWKLRDDEFFFLNLDYNPTETLRRPVGSRLGRTLPSLPLLTPPTRQQRAGLKLVDQSASPQCSRSANECVKAQKTHRGGRGGGLSWIHLSSSSSSSVVSFPAQCYINKQIISGFVGQREGAGLTNLKVSVLFWRWFRFSGRSWIIFTIKRVLIFTLGLGFFCSDF